MKYGFCTIPRAPIWRYIQFACLAERLGYDQAWVPDQTFFFDPFPILALAGSQTEQLQWGVGVTNPYSRSAVQVARTMSTIASAVGRPVNLGIGTGNRRELLLPLGIEQTKPAERCREMIQIVRSVLSGKTVTYESDTAILRGVQLKFEVEHSVPIYLAARGAATLGLAGELANGVLIGDLVSDAGLNYAKREIAKGAQKTGRSLNEIDLVAWVPCVITMDNEEEAYDRLRPWVAHNMSASPPAVQREIGLDEEHIQSIRSAYFAGGADAAGKLITNEDVERLAIIGNPCKCAEVVRRLARHGINHLVLNLSSEVMSENEATMRRFMEEVVPLV